MANYCCAIRTNYFCVKDEEKFRELMARVHGCEDDIRVWERKVSNGKTMFGFGLYGEIAGVKHAREDDDDEFDDTSYGEFISGLQSCVADHDAIIIMEAGNEKLRYVLGSATIITSRSCEYISIDRLAVSRASEMLGVERWSTKCEY